MNDVDPPGFARRQVRLGSGLYDYPLLYEALRGPSSQAIAALTGILRARLERPPSSVLDPACGPGSWLEPFARQSLFTAGNDLSASMVAAARSRLPQGQSEVREGDMRALSFSSGPFDAAFELSGAIALLRNTTDTVQFLRSLASTIGAGGVALLTVYFSEGSGRPSPPYECWSYGPVALRTGGRASVRYQIVTEDSVRGFERIRRTVHVNGDTEYPPLIADEYVLRIWTPGDFIRLLEESKSFALDSVFRPQEPGWRHSRVRDLAGERLVALRRL